MQMNQEFATHKAFSVKAKNDSKIEEGLRDIVILMLRYYKKI